MNQTVGLLNGGLKMEHEMIDEIRKKRAKAISNSDKKYAKQFLEKDNKSMLPLFFTIGVLVLLLSVLLVWRVVENPTVIVQENLPIINEYHNTYNLVNETNIDVTEEYVIKGDKEMVCIENANNKKQMICYR